MYMYLQRECRQPVWRSVLNRARAHGFLAATPHACTHQELASVTCDMFLSSLSLAEGKDYVVVKKFMIIGPPTWS